MSLFDQKCTEIQKSFPKLPGIYLFKNSEGEILYIGKAKSLRNRVLSYFQKYAKDWKIKALIDEHETIDFILTKSEREALLLEAQLVREHKPKYNVLLKEGNPFLYILFTNDTFPMVKIVRNKEEKGTYFGPFLEKRNARTAFRFIIQTFQLFICNKKIKNGCLDYHLGFCAGSCRSDFDKDGYLFRLELASNVFNKDRDTFLQKIMDKIDAYNKSLNFEKSRTLNKYLINIDTIFKTIESHFSPEKYAFEIASALVPSGSIPAVPSDIDIQLQQFFHLDQRIKVVDCFDISHSQSKNMVGSCIRFINGKPEKNKFRRFLIKTILIQNDYAALQEIVQRRYKDGSDLPDLALIDGGKGQLNAVKSLYPQLFCASLAKREETVYAATIPDGKKLSVQSDVGKLLIALRDYAHHFAITFHRLRSRKGYQRF